MRNPRPVEHLLQELERQRCFVQIWPNGGSYDIQGWQLVGGKWPTNRGFVLACSDCAAWPLQRSQSAGLVYAPPSRPYWSCFSVVQRPQSWTELNGKAKLRFPKVKDETVQRINHTIFPSLNLCQREGWGFYGYMYIYHNAIIFFPHRILHESLGTIISPILIQNLEGKANCIMGNMKLAN